YVTSTPYDPLVTPVYTISFGGRVEVPQNCELNAGQIVEFDFGDIGASLFGNDSNLLIVFYVQIMPDDFVMQLH
ncbi:hypothetical protein SNB39_00800, partial [Escherichia coli]|nr:hypothetical protein [Escherichia coli]